MVEAILDHIREVSHSMAKKEHLGFGEYNCYADGLRTNFRYPRKHEVILAKWNCKGKRLQ